MALIAIYSCGLRLSEGYQVLTCDIDRARMFVHVSAGKGGRDRYVPLPRFALPRGPWVFTNREATGPLHTTSLQKTFAAVVPGAWP